MTASFGVTEVQAGDSDTSFLARADRALLLAKETGRNRVVQLGVGGDATEDLLIGDLVQNAAQGFDCHSSLPLAS